MNLLNLSSIFISIFANMVETIINHPPVITIFMGARNHSQSWLVDSIVLPAQPCPAFLLPSQFPRGPRGTSISLSWCKFQRCHPTPPHRRSWGPWSMYTYIYTHVYIYTYIGVGTVIIGNYLLQYSLTIPKVHILWFVISRPPTRTWTLLLPFSSPPLLRPRQLQLQQPRQPAVDLSQRFAPWLITAGKGGTGKGTTAMAHLL